jgi:hypothetical protein
MLNCGNEDKFFCKFTVARNFVSIIIKKNKVVGAKKRVIRAFAYV